MSFDSKCFDLAEHFLADEWDEVPTAMKNDLAQAIQSAVEDWFTLRQIEQGDGPAEEDAP